MDSVMLSVMARMVWLRLAVLASSRPISGAVRATVPSFLVVDVDGMELPSSYQPVENNSER